MIDVIAKRLGRISTFWRIFGDTLAPGVNVRETAERETPAFSATSWALTNSFCDKPVSVLAARFA